MFAFVLMFAIVPLTKARRRCIPDAAIEQAAKQMGKP